MKNYLFLVPVLALMACKSSDAKQLANAAPCDPGATELAKQLSAANGYNMDLSDPKTQATIDAAKKAILGKKFAFKNCKFTSQGNDTVSFAATKGAEHDIDCKMAGGDDGNKKFRHAAMDFDMAKLQLDVSGTIKEIDGHFDKDIVLADCTITPHE